MSTDNLLKKIEVIAGLCKSIAHPNDPLLRKLAILFPEAFADSSLLVKDKALDAVIAFLKALKAVDADSGSYAKVICSSVAKCLCGPEIVEKAKSVFMLWVELEAIDVVLDAMETAIKFEVAEAVVAAIDVMFQALSEFGDKVVPPEKIMKMLPELFDHQDQNVRGSAKRVTCELCRWIGKETVKSNLLEKMPVRTKKELEAEFVNVTGTAKPSRKIRSKQDKEIEQKAVAEVVGTGPSEESVADAPKEIDDYELAAAVDILSDLKKTGFCDRVKDKKWSVRKKAVAKLTKLAATKRIAPGDFTDICQILEQLIIDVNIAVAVEAIQAIKNLAKGLRTHFSGNSRFLLPVLLEKLKEKKPTVSEALSQTLQAMYQYGCLNLADIVKDVKTVQLVHPLTLNCIAFCTETSNKAIILKIFKEYVPICAKCINDGTPEMRNEALKAAVAIAKCLNDGTPEVRDAALEVLAALDEPNNEVRGEALEVFPAAKYETTGSSRGGTGTTNANSATTPTSGGSSPSGLSVSQLKCAAWNTPRPQLQNPFSPLPSKDDSLVPAFSFGSHPTSEPFVFGTQPQPTEPSTDSRTTPSGGSIPSGRSVSQLKCAAWNTPIPKLQNPFSLPPSKDDSLVPAFSFGSHPMSEPFVFGAQPLPTEPDSRITPSKRERRSKRPKTPNLDTRSRQCTLPPKSPINSTRQLLKGVVTLFHSLLLHSPRSLNNGLQNPSSIGLQYPRSRRTIKDKQNVTSSYVVTKGQGIEDMGEAMELLGLEDKGTESNKKRKQSEFLSRKNEEAKKLSGQVEEEREKYHALDDKDNGFGTVRRLKMMAPRKTLL